MHSAVRLHHIRHLAHFKPERRVLERLLHHPPPERPKVASVSVRRTVRLRVCELCEFRGQLVGGNSLEGSLVLAKLGDGVLL